MRLGEKSLIMIKPKWGYGQEDKIDILPLPKGWETEEKAAILRRRRLFYEVKLHSWIIRHDLLGDKRIIKTMHQKGVGYDRPFDFDEITLDLKVY